MYKHVFVYRQTSINLKASISKMSLLFRNRAISLKRVKNFTMVGHLCIKKKMIAGNFGVALINVMLFNHEKL